MNIAERIFNGIRNSFFVIAKSHCEKSVEKVETARRKRVSNMCEGYNRLRLAR